MSSGLLALAGLLPVRGEDHDHVAAVLLRRRLHESQRFNVICQTGQEAETEFGAGLLPAAEHDRRLDLVALTEEALYVTLLGLIVVLVDLRAEFHLLDDRVGLIAAGFACLLGGLVLVRSEE